MKLLTGKRLIEAGVLIVVAIALLFSIKYIIERSGRTEGLKEVIVEPRIEYGIVVDSFSIVKDVVRSGDNLSVLLSRYGVAPGVIEQLVLKSKDVFDVRKIRAGNTYKVLCTNDSLQKVEYFIYEHTPVQYVVFETGDSVHVYVGEKEVLVTLKAVTANITSSMWNAIMDANASPALAVALSEIYAWNIDFYAIQQGDNFTVVYEDLSVDGGEGIGMGNILTARFQHGGKDNYAFRFIQDEKADYFDDEGQSLRRAFLKAPLKYSRISSTFSHSRMHPVLRIRRPHHGVDYAAPRGTPVHSVGSGTVQEARFAGGAGRMVKIRHNATYTTAYLHLSGFGPGIKAGARVQQGQVIGYVGSSGLSTGPHLDFRFYQNGTPVDPLKVESPPALPVKEALLDSFNLVRSRYMHQLDSLIRN